MFWVTVIVLVIFLIPVISLLIRWRLSYGVLRSCGISGPSPVLYFGNGKQIKALTLLKFIETNSNKYGDIFGYYVGIQPNIAVMDLEMLRQIMIKQFDAFTDRPNNPDLIRKKTESKARGLFSSEGEDWRRMRRILSKSFNAINLSKMSPIIDNSCEALLAKLSEHVNKKDSFDIWKLYGLFTMEVILATAFGHKIDVINGEADELAAASSSIFAFAQGGTGTSVTTILSNFPFMEFYVRSQALKTKAAKNYIYVEELTKQLVRTRLEQEHQGNYQDLLQLLIDARADPDDDEETGYQIKDLSKRKLTDIEIVRTALGFLLAGHETTNNTLAYVSYLLALHPEEQEKLYQEIVDFYSNKPSATLYEAAHSLVYLDMTIQEALRIFPPAPITLRRASKNIKINGQMFPKGCSVIIPILPIHHSPDIWPSPSVFRPERFSKEEKEKRHQMAHMPFGWGPRSCIGMRLALMEAKMALIAIVKEYKFIEAPDTEKPLKTTVGITMIPTNGIYLQLQKR